MSPSVERSTKKKIIATSGVVVVAIILILWLLNLPTLPLVERGGYQNLRYGELPEEKPWGQYPDNWSPSPMYPDWLGFENEHWSANIYVVFSQDGAVGTFGGGEGVSGDETLYNVTPNYRWQCLNDTIFGSWFTCPSSGRAENMVAYLAILGTGHRQKCAIYRKTDNTLVGSTEWIGGWGTTGTKWWTFEFSDPKPSLVGGEDYWLLCWCNHSTYLLGDLAIPEELGVWGWIILIIVISGAVITMVWGSGRRWAA